MMIPESIVKKLELGRSTAAAASFMNNVEAREFTWLGDQAFVSDCIIPDGMPLDEGDLCFTILTRIGHGNKLCRTVIVDGQMIEALTKEEIIKVLQDSV